MKVNILNSKKISEMVKNNEFKLIIDLRDEELYLEGHLPKAVNIPTGEINDNLEQIRSVTNDGILVYCANGNQSIAVGKVLLLDGFNNVYSLANGIKNYRYKLYK
ncbi:rhodanese-like domain-containing protein [Terrisporobacter petrolearius]|uniref:rhodanese-like domain-containing protein n=1 Tax=Terrisporobacter petrolearius TaxID=1460447 RepID=UPI0031CC574F